MVLLFDADHKPFVHNSVEVNVAADGNSWPLVLIPFRSNLERDQAARGTRISTFAFSGKHGTYKEALPRPTPTYFLPEQGSDKLINQVVELLEAPN